MKTKLSRWYLPALLGALLASTVPMGAQSDRRAESPEIQAGDRLAIVEDLASALDSTYVFPEVAARMANHLRSRAHEGGYEELGSLSTFCDRLTEELQEISHDKHLRVFWRPSPAGDGAEPPTEAEERARRLERLRRGNFCFEKVEHLAGNVGYLRLDCFASAESAGPTAIAAMGFLGASDALIFDLRRNGGGDPSMIQLLTSYLLEESKHLNSFYVRATDSTEQYWSHAYVPGPRMPEVPVFVLTSSRTFSAAEEFSYNIQSLGRGKIVGETTGGGAHPVDGHRVAGYDVVMMLPYGRAINPITGTNWEGTGVAPDIEVPEYAALERAHAEALRVLESRSVDEEAKQALRWVREGVEAVANPAPLPEAALRAFTGSFGPRVISLEGATLRYRRGDRPSVELVPIGERTFVAPALDYFRLEFELGDDGRAVRVFGLYADGGRDSNERTAP